MAALAGEPDEREMPTTLIAHDAHDPPALAAARYTAQVRVSVGGMVADVLVIVTEAALVRWAEAAAASETGRASREAGGVMAVVVPPGR